MKFCKKCGKQIHVKSDYCKECRTAGPRLCACGCGELVTNPNIHVRFIAGHSNRSPDIIQKKKQTCIERYGVDNISKLQSCKDLKKQKSLERYGTECVFQSEEIKEAIKNTCIEKFGVDNPRKAESVKEKSKQTCLERYGVEYVTQVESVKEKSKQTCIERYGVNIASKSQIVKDKVRKTMIERFGCWNSQTKECIEKARRTCIERYGVDWYVQTEEQKRKSRETCIQRYGVEYSSSAEEVKEIKRLANQEKYGVDNPLQLKWVRDKIEETCLQKYGTEKLFHLERIQNAAKLKQRTLSWNIFSKRNDWIPQFTKEEFLEKGWTNSDGSRNTWKFKCSVCGEISELTTLQIHCQNCKTVGRSFNENEIFTYIKSLLLDIEVISNARRIMDDTRKELDVYIPSKNLAVEFDGLYWHSLKFDTPESSLIHKTNLCKNKGIQLIHIFEHEWYHNEDKIKSLINSKLGIYDTKIYARKCKCLFLNGSDYAEFLINNSLNEDPECAYSIGLIYNDELISVMTIKTCKLSDEFEIYNLCYKKNCYVIGGTEKMFNFFIKHIYAKKIISYVDKRFFTGNCFYRLGFNKVDDISPKCWLVDGFNLSEIKEKPIDLSKMIYDCGSILFEWKNPIV